MSIQEEDIRAVNKYAPPKIHIVTIMKSRQKDRLKYNTKRIEYLNFLNG